MKAIQIKWLFFILLAAITFITLACEMPSTANANTRTIVVPKPTIDTPKVHLENVLKEYQAFVNAAIDTLKLPSVAYAIVKDGKVIQQYTYGYKKAQEKTQ